MGKRSEDPVFRGLEDMLWILAIGFGLIGLIILAALLIDTPPLVLLLVVVPVALGCFGVSGFAIWGIKEGRKQ